MITLKQRREEASFYCEKCSYCTDAQGGGVLCEHSGHAQFIAYSSKKCPIGSWDHSAPITGPFTRLEKKLDPIPRDRWSEEMLRWAGQRIASDIGLGDTLHRVGSAASRAVLLMLVPNVKCSARVRTANELFPYG